MENSLTTLIEQLETAAVDNPIVVLLNLSLAFIVGATIALVYKHVHHGISYSQSYAFSIVMVTMVVALAMMVVGSDITRAFALLGTFTIIRYRTAVKDPKDTAFIFASLVLGLAAGSSNYAIVAIGTPAMSIVALGLHHFNFGSMVKLEYVLYATIDKDKVDQPLFEETLRKMFAHIELLNLNYDSDKNFLVYSYNVKTDKQNSDHTKIIKALTAVNGVEGAELLASQNVIEF